MNSDLTLGDLLSTLLDSYSASDKKQPGVAPVSLTCSSCGTTYEEFIQKGRFGCSECYRSFNGQLGKTLKSIQGAEQHTGKRPKGFVVATVNKAYKNISESEKLAILLQEAIEKEEFEEAARLRDLIKQLKKEEQANA